MSSIIVQKAKRIVDGLEYGAFITAKEWETRNFDNYFNYFTDPDPEVRKYSLFVFAAGIGNWYSKSAFVFQPLEELKKDPLYDPDAVYYFPDYIESFLINQRSIKTEYPELYRMIILFLIKLDDEKPFETLFPEHAMLFKQLREVLSNSEFDSDLVYDDFKEFLKRWYP